MSNYYDGLVLLKASLETLSFIKYVDFFPEFKNGQRYDAIMIKEAGTSDVVRESGRTVVTQNIELYYITNDPRRRLKKTLAYQEEIIKKIDAGISFGEKFRNVTLTDIDPGNFKEIDFDVNDPEAGYSNAISVRFFNYEISYCQ